MLTAPLSVPALLSPACWTLKQGGKAGKIRMPTILVQSLSLAGHEAARSEGLKTSMAVSDSVN